MPVAIDQMYDALLVVLDERREGKNAFFKEEVTRAFDKRKMIYCTGADQSAEELYREVNEKIDREEVLFPASERIVFCTYLDMCDLDETWLQRFVERMKLFKERSMVADLSQHYHVNVFRYQAGKGLGEKQQEVMRTFMQLWDHTNTLMYHTEFLMYKGGIGGTLDKQERSLIRLLKISGMKGWTNVFSAQNFMGNLYVLSETEYYESRTAECQAKRAEVVNWLNNQKDPNLTNFVTGLNQKMNAWMQRYQEEKRQFKREAGLYPMPADAYTSSGFGPWKRYCRPEGIHRELQQEEQKWQDAFAERLQNSEEKEPWKAEVVSGMGYRDLFQMSQKWEMGALQKSLKSMAVNCGSAKGIEQEQAVKFAELFQTWVEELVAEEAAEEKLLEKKEEKEALRTRYETEIARANQFENLQMCFANIKAQTAFQLPAVLVPAPVGEIAMINGEIAGQWARQGYQIAGVLENTVLIWEAIFPYEIVYLKIGKCGTLNLQETEQRLRTILL